MNSVDDDGEGSLLVVATDEPDAQDGLTTEELQTAVRALPSVDLKRLSYAAIIMTRGMALTPDELVNNAVYAALVGRRKCPRDTPVAVFLYGVMRSLASATRKTASNRPIVQFPTVPPGKENPIDCIPDIRLNPEQMLLDREDEEEASRDKASAKAAARKLEEHLSGDFEAQMCIEGMKEGLVGRELRECVGVDQAGLDYAKKRIRRASAKLFPRGWRNVEQ